MTATYLGEITGKLRHRCCGLYKVRRKPKYQVTAVNRYVTRRQQRVARALRALFQEWARKFAEKIRAAIVSLPIHRAAGKPVKLEDQIMKDVIEALNVDGMTQDLADELEPELKTAFKKAGLASAKNILGKTPVQLIHQIDKKALEYARKRAAELVGKSGGEWSVSGATKVGLRKLVTAAIEEGWTVDQLASEVEDSFLFSEGRAQTLARTELAMSHVEGNVQGWRETGIVDRKRSLLGDLHDIEDECDENAEAGPVELEDEFPSGDKFPPYHPNCVCDVIPVMEGEE